MKTLITRISRKVVPGLALAAFAVTTPLHAQTSPAVPPTSTAEAAPQKLSAADLQDLTGPIALYPDALVALIMPAAANPSDITMAARYLKQNGDDANVDDQPWDSSVRSLAKYPDVLKWMDENLEWTTSLGEAFVEQPADVMNAVQELRLAAKENGNLRNTPQQTVVVEQAPATQTETVREVVRIVPSDPEVIYVPVYDPEVVYVQPYQPDYVTPFITFGVGFAVGAWLNYDCDWGNDNIYWGNGCGWNNRNRWYDRGWDNGNNDGYNVTNITNNNTNIVNNGQGSQWQPNANSRRYFERRQQQNIGNARIARANAAVRQPTTQQLRNQAQRQQAMANRPARVAKPQRAAAIRQNTAANRPKTGKVTAAQNAPAAGKNKPNAAVKPANKPQAITPANRPKPASVAPNVAAQENKKPNAAKPGNKPVKPAPQTADRPANKKPNAAPAVDGSVAKAKPKKNNGNSNPQADRPAPNAAPKKQPKPTAEPRPQQPAPQAAKPKPQKVQQPQQQQPRPKVQKPQPKVEQPRPQQVNPQPAPKAQKPQSNGGTQKPANPNQKKKKKVEEDS
jgi:hypothetical protein